MRLEIFVVFCVISCESKLLVVEDDSLNLMKSAGYEGEAHEVETEDGHLLRLHRLLPKMKTERKPVFLMHGILATSADFLITGPKIALGFLLADNGYDVWLGNARGNKYSTNHRNHSSFSKEFWNFSWHEIGFYDLPAMINYMLNTTKASQAFYAAHSQGTTSFLVLLSTRPEFNDKIVQAHLMAPSAFRKKLPRLKTVLYFFEYLVSQ
jgi:pimeloyl-ACP methyl ester carboxylesterase